MIRRLLVTVVASGAVILAHAPPPPQAQVAFEVVSIKRNPNRGPVVIDATGLEGDYEFDLEWNPIPLSDQPVDRPSLFVAVEEQLGMRLQPDRGVVEIVVIEDIERPTPD